MECVSRINVHLMENVTLREFHKNYKQRKIKNLHEFKKEILTMKLMFKREYYNHTTAMVAILLHTTTIMILLSLILMLNTVPLQKLTTTLTAITALQI